MRIVAILEAASINKIMLRLLVAGIAATAIIYGLVQLVGTRAGLEIQAVDIDGTPATLFRLADAEPAPAVVIAHGFAGSRQLMESFAMTLARNGFVAISFDFLGHGRNRQPLTGDVTLETGATAVLVRETQKVIAYAHDVPGSDGQVALLGHSMASDIIVRVAIADPRIAATVAVSMFSNEVTADRPRNLLMIAGSLEEFLIEHAKAALSQVAGDEPQLATTYGNLADGRARRLAIATGVEHVGVLFSATSLREAESWLSSTFERSSKGEIATRGSALLWLFAGLIALVWPMASLLPRADVARSTENTPGWRRLGLLIFIPAILTPLLLWKAPWDVLAIQVADYLAFHFFIYGALTLAGLWMAGARLPSAERKTWVMAAIVSVVWVALIGLPIDWFVASFWPHPGRIPVILMLAAGTLIYTIADAWLAQNLRTGVGLLSKMAFVGSLAAAIALNLEALFFLAIIFPVIVLFFLVYGLMGWWVGGRVGHPLVVGIANGVAFAWALGVTFPLLA